jgi:predicted ATP-binding protein involved in virulence
MRGSIMKKIKEIELVVSIGTGILIATGILMIRVDNTSRGLKHIRRKQSEIENEFKFQKDKIEDLNKLHMELTKKIDMDLEQMGDLDKVREDIIDLKAKHREVLTNMRADKVMENKVKKKGFFQKASLF